MRGQRKGPGGLCLPTPWESGEVGDPPAKAEPKPPVLLGSLLQQSSVQRGWGTSQACPCSYSDQDKASPQAPQEEFQALRTRESTWTKA